MTPLTKLRRRIDRAIDAGRGITFTESDVDLLVTTGAYGVLCGAANDQQRILCLKRSAKQHSIDGDLTGSIGTSDEAELDDLSSRSSGTIPSGEKSGELQRARRSLKPPSNGSTLSTSNGRPAKPPAPRAASRGTGQAVTS